MMDEEGMEVSDSCEEEEEEMKDMEEGEQNEKPRVFLPGRDKMEEGEELEMDHSAYKVYHRLTPQSSCLSFDLLRNITSSKEFPFTCHVVAGTAVTPSQINRVQVMKISNIRETKKADDSEDSDSDSEEDLDEKPEVEMAEIRHNGSVNRLRTVEHAGACLAASWSEHGIVYVWDLSRPISAVNDSLSMAEYVKTDAEPVTPLHVFNGHTQEGYAMDWNPHRSGELLTGDCTGKIHFWQPKNGASGWKISSVPFSSHTASVEDIQWSPTEATVFCSVSVDRTIRVWDTRAPPDRGCQITSPDAHDADINVVSWNRLNSCHLLSGGDEGHLKVWDLRQFARQKNGQTTPLACLKHHSDPVTSVEWHPSEASVFAASVSGKKDGDQLTLWDISVESGTALAVEGDETNVGGTEDLPPQLMFVHMGQEELKELHWHRQLPGLLISTAADSFNIFQPVNM